MPRGSRPARFQRRLTRRPSSPLSSCRADLCSWHGITCTPIVTPKIVEDIDLSANGLAGTFPAADKLVPHGPKGDEGLFMLKQLDMSNNTIGGQLPDELARMWSLRILNVGQNKLTGTFPEKMNNLTGNPSAFTFYPALMEIDLNNNMISGTLPADLFGAPVLPIFNYRDAIKTVNVRFNKLTGELPDTIFRLTYMSGIGKGGALLLNGNEMSGGPAINSTFNDFLANIQYCDLTGQKFNGLSAATLKQCVR